METLSIADIIEEAEKKQNTGGYVLLLRAYGVETHLPSSLSERMALALLPTNGPSDTLWLALQIRLDHWSTREP